MSRAGRLHGGALLALALYALAMAWLLRLPCRWPSGAERFPGLCAGDAAPPAGSLLGAGPPGEAPPLVRAVSAALGWFAANVSALLGTAPSAAEHLPRVLLLLAWPAVVVVVLRVTGSRADALVTALAPAVLVAGFRTWDLWAVLCLVLALLLHDRGRAAAAGVLLGLGASVSLFPAAVLVAVLFLAVRHRRLREAGLVLLGAVLTWALVNGPAVLSSWERWAAGAAALAGRPVADSPFWSVWGRLVRAVTGSAPEGTGVHVLLPLAVVLVAVLVLSVLARQEPGTAQVSFLVLAPLVLLVTAQSMVQGLWLVPLVVLAGRSRWELVAWQLVELLHWAVLVLPPGTWPGPPWTGAGALEALGVLRVLLLGALVVAVAVDVLRGARSPRTVAAGSR